RSHAAPSAAAETKSFCMVSGGLHRTARKVAPWPSNLPVSPEASQGTERRGGPATRKTGGTGFMHQASPGSSGSRRRFSAPYVQRQHDALAALTALSMPGGGQRGGVRPRPESYHGRVSGRDRGVRRPRPVRLAPREKAPGALNETYDIP